MEREPRTPTPIDELAERWLDQLLDLVPELHVELGRPGREGAYADLSPDGHAARDLATRRTLTAVRAAEPTDAVDRITRAELIRTLELEAEQHDAGFWMADLNVLASPAQGLREIFDLMPTDTTEHWEHVADRMHRLPSAMAGYVASLRAGIRSGTTPAIRQVEAVAAQAERHADPVHGFFGRTASSPKAPDELRGHLRDGAERAAGAYAHLRRFLRDELAPHARREDAVGRDWYALASRGFVGVEIDLEETYAWGVEELARMVSEQEAAADAILPGAGVKEVVAHLESDPGRRLHGTDALQAWMQRVSDRAVDDLGAMHFEIPEPVRRLECRIAPTQEGGIYYTGPSEDFTRAGRMWWSVPEGVDAFDPWRELTTVYHEGVPGHHLQIGLATYNSGQLNGWRRLNWNSGHGEGWALYAERLMADLGYLDDPADRLGMLDGQRMRAARVVADIGAHLRLEKPDGSGRWTGEDVFPFMLEHVNMNEPFVRFESDRYLGWAGQAPSYKVGQRLWEQLRDAWVAEHGPELKAFHAEALGVGSIGLGTLRTALLDPSAL
ncbi:uncharacterized protein (DUF885 family) [Mumia flava]|uniref:Uncharacterized protein (DUF885 family) n=1 Tax=Mumia flava TaxID=1348852 RepID=A0A0B2BQU2_9ACTN|nr:DUF885 domain-containing protein [Mumia flava]PJJ58085.1 uncharacterized protein (DUF885 family) [Mumia flava]